MDSEKTLREEINDNIICYMTDINVVTFRCYQENGNGNCIEFNKIDKKDCKYYKNGYCNNVISNAITATKIAYDIFNIVEKYEVSLSENVDRTYYKKQCEYANIHCKEVYKERKEKEINNDNNGRIDSTNN